MKRMKWLAVLALLMPILLFSFSGSAMAAGDWKSAYASLLKQDIGQQKAIGLCDLTGDGSPEMVVLSISGGTGLISAYTMDSGALQPMVVKADRISLKGVKSAGMTQRMDGSKNACLTLSIKSVSGKTTTNRLIGIKKSGATELTAVYQAHTQKKSGKTTYYVSDKKTTKSKYNSAKKSYEKSYKKVGTVTTKLIAAKDKAASVQTKLNAASKKYTSFSTVKKLTLSKSKATITAGKTVKLTAKISPSTAVYDTIAWTSADAKIATVSGGVVTGVSGGKVKITAKTQSGKSKSCTITVKAPAATGVEVADKTVTLSKNDSKTLSASVLPAAASQTLAWTSSNKAVATVSSGGVVKGVASGTAVLTAKTGNGKKATCNIVVTEGPVIIVDISQHNYSTKMDWKKISENVQLLILRCGVTRTDTNPIGVGIDAKFAYYAQQCKAYGIPFGVYYYGKCSDEATAIEEAKMTWQTASPYNPLFYVYDVEESRLTKPVIETYMKTLKSLGAKKTGYYIAHHLYSTYKLDTSLVDFIWIPRYGKNTGEVDELPKHTCDLHQYTSLGRIPGFPYYVDINQLTGRKSLEWFLAR